jgi:hypothetical protein
MDYPSNSNKDKEKDNSKAVEPVKKVEKVELEGQVLTRKTPIGSRIKSIFLGGEFKSAAQYIGAEVLLPALRNLLVDATTKGIERVVYGDSSYNRPRTPEYRPRVTYNNPVNRGYSRDPRERANLPDQPSRPRPRHDRTEIILASRGDAELILERLQDIIDRYQVASMADLHELVGLPTTHVDNKWGWESIRFAEIRQIREGYLLDLPPAETI